MPSSPSQITSFQEVLVSSILSEIVSGPIALKIARCARTNGLSCIHPLLITNKIVIKHQTVSSRLISLFS